MKESALVIKQTGVACAERAVTLLTFIILNAIFILPLVLFILSRLSGAD